MKKPVENTNKDLLGGSVSCGIEIQRDQLDVWAKVLKPEVMAKVRFEAQRQNEFLTGDSRLHDVWRGTDIDVYIHNIKENNY